MSVLTLTRGQGPLAGLPGSLTSLRLSKGNGLTVLPLEVQRILAAGRAFDVASALCRVGEITEFLVMCFGQSWDVEWIIFTVS